MTVLRLPVHSYNLPSRAPSRLVNCYAQQAPGKQPVEIASVPGIATAAELPGPGRGMVVAAGVLYAVSGTGLYRITAAGNAELLGTVPGTQRLTLAANNVAPPEIVTSNGYIYTAGEVSKIVSEYSPRFGVVTGSDGYIFYTIPGGELWGASDLNDGGTYLALDVASPSAMNDKVVSIAVDHRQVLTFGEQSIELWYFVDRSDGSFNWERLAGGPIEVGTLSPWSVVRADNSTAFLAADRTARIVRGSTAVRISQHGVEERIAKYDTVEDCIGLSWGYEGHMFVAFQFPSAGACWVHDIATGEWSERRSTWNSPGWDVADIRECYGRVWVQGASSGDIGYMTRDTHTEFGGLLRREWTYPQIWEEGMRVFHSKLDLTMRTGNAPIGTVAHVNLDVSDDGGNTWRSAPHRELGNVGEYAQRIRWWRLGMARDRVYRCSVTDDVPVTVLETSVQVDSGGA